MYWIVTTMNLKAIILRLKLFCQFLMTYTVNYLEKINDFLENTYNSKNDKIFAISFKYHEAYALEAILRHFISNADEAYSDPYVKNTAHVIANKIHQEL